MTQQTQDQAIDGLVATFPYRAVSLWLHIAPRGEHRPALSCLHLNLATCRAYVTDSFMIGACPITIGDPPEHQSSFTIGPEHMRVLQATASPDADIHLCFVDDVWTLRYVAKSAPNHSFFELTLPVVPYDGKYPDLDSLIDKSPKPGTVDGAVPYLNIDLVKRFLRALRVTPDTPHIVFGFDKPDSAARMQVRDGDRNVLIDAVIMPMIVTGTETGEVVA